MGVQGVQEPPRRFGHLFHRAVERRFVGLRRLVEAGKLSNELQRRGLDLVLGRRRLEIELGLDIAAHELLPGLPSHVERPNAAPVQMDDYLT